MIIISFIYKHFDVLLNWWRLNIEILMISSFIYSLRDVFMHLIFVITEAIKV